jgi:hypothetical protein
MTVADSIKAELDEAQFVIQQQMGRIAELEAELECLKSSLDAHGTLRLIYSNPNSPEGNRIKAAAAALPVERPKLTSVPPPLELVANKPTMTLTEQAGFRQTKVRQLAERGELLFQNEMLPRPNGNGQDDTGS